MVVVGVDGSVLSPTVGGSEQIATLVQQALRPAGASGLRGGDRPGLLEAPERDASNIGAPAPDVVLNHLDGREVALSDFYEGTSLLLFWNPRCGYCLRMLPQLQALAEAWPSRLPRVVVVSTGEVPDIKEQAIPGRLLHNPNGLAMRAFGAGGTPMGVMVKEGELRSPSPAAGADAVLQPPVRGRFSPAQTALVTGLLLAVARAHMAPGDRTRHGAGEGASEAAP